jgi:Cu2+-containing amine oxidase
MGEIIEVGSNRLHVFCVKLGTKSVDGDQNNRVFLDGVSRCAGAGGKPRKKNDTEGD